MVGVGLMLKVELVAVPPAVVTVIGPVVAPDGTTTTNCVLVFETIGAGVAVPVNVTVAFCRFVPLIVTCDPTPPLGVMPLIVGGSKLIVVTAWQADISLLFPTRLVACALTNPEVAVPERDKTLNMERCPVHLS